MQDELFEHTRKLKERKLTGPIEKSVVSPQKVNDRSKNHLYLVRRKGKSPPRRGLFWDDSVSRQRGSTYSEVDARRVEMTEEEAAQEVKKLEEEKAKPEKDEEDTEFETRFKRQFMQAGYGQEYAKLMRDQKWKDEAFSTIGDEEFHFDDSVVNSKTYRRAIAALQRPAQRTEGSAGEKRDHGSSGDQHLATEEDDEDDEEEEGKAATTQESMFMMSQDVASTPNALRMAAAAEESRRNTLARLSEQGERLQNTNSGLSLAPNLDLAANETERGLRRLNKSMFVTHTKNPYLTSGLRKREEERSQEVSGPEHLSLEGGDQSIGEDAELNLPRASLFSKEGNGMSSRPSRAMKASGKGEDRDQELEHLRRLGDALSADSPLTTKERRRTLAESGDTLQRLDRLKLLDEESTSLPSDDEEYYSTVVDLEVFEASADDKVSDKMASSALEVDAIDELLMQWTTLSNDDIVGMKVREEPLLAEA